MVRFTRVPRLVFLTLLVGWVASCRSIVGLDEFTVEPAESSDDAGPQGSGNGGSGNTGDGDASAGGTANGSGGGNGASSNGGSGPGGASGAPSGNGGNSGNPAAGGMSGESGVGPDGCPLQPEFSPCETGPGMCDGQCQTANSPMGSYDVCVRSCTADDCGGAFQTGIVSCGPPNVDFPCVFLCDDGCLFADEISCPGNTPCTIDCTAPDSCQFANITCRGGGCLVVCSDQGCDDTTQVTCGSGPCLVDCAQGGDVDLRLEAASCHAEKLGCGP